MVTGFLAGRSLARESIQKIFSTSIEHAHVAGLSFEDDTILSVTYVSKNIDSLSQLLSYYETDNAYFTQVISKGISRAKDGSYQLSLILTLPREDKK